MKYKVFSTVEVTGFGLFEETQAEFLYLEDALKFWEEYKKKYEGQPYFEIWDESCEEKGFSFWFECAGASLGVHLMKLQK